MFPLEYTEKWQCIYRQGACPTANVMLCSMAFVDVLCSISSVSDGLSLSADVAASVNCERAQFHVGEHMHIVHRDGRAMQPFMHNGVTEAHLLYSSEYCAVLISACQLDVLNLHSHVHAARTFAMAEGAQQLQQC